MDASAASYCVRHDAPFFAESSFAESILALKPARSVTFSRRNRPACDHLSGERKMPLTFMEITVGITGASGAIYAHRTLVHLASSVVVERINLILSESARTVAMVELGFDLRSADEKKISEWIGLPGDSKLVRLHRLDNMAATPSSGSHPQVGMIIVPCSMGTLGAIASGAGTNLIHRAADVTLKEGRKLVLVPRETPYNAIHLENMLKLSRAGARILPASPGFYHRPQTLEALVDHLCFRILDQFGIPHSTATRWKGE
jgi:4-hydroxy-3-polyprenylbenzoate decarboxylase